jgi:hypothetical protein
MNCIALVDVLGMLTTEIITCNKNAHDLLETVAATLPTRAFHSDWTDVDGYYDNMVQLSLDLGKGFTCRDLKGRLMVVLPGRRGNIIYFDRHGGRSK